MVLTDHPDPELIFLSYSLEDNIRELKTLHHLSLYERSARPAEFFTDVLLDPSGSVLVVSCYTGKLKVVVLDGGAYENDFDVTCVRLSFCFYHDTLKDIGHTGSQSSIFWLLRFLLRAPRWTVYV